MEEFVKNNEGRQKELSSSSQLASSLPIPTNSSIQDDGKEEEKEGKKHIYLEKNQLEKEKPAEKVFNFDDDDEEVKEFLKNHPKKEKPFRFKTFTDLSWLKIDLKNYKENKKN